MEALTHQRAWRLLHAGRRYLSAADRRALDGHLAACPACRFYAADLEVLEPALSGALHARRDVLQALRPKAYAGAMTDGGVAVGGSSGWPRALEVCLMAGAMLVLLILWATRPLGDQRQQAAAPALAPSSRLGLIAFESFQDGHRKIGIITADSGDQMRLWLRDAGDGDDFGPAWSPEGEHIAFFSDRAGQIEVFVANADSSPSTGRLPVVIQVTGVSNHVPGVTLRWVTTPVLPGLTAGLTWSPDGHQIAALAQPLADSSAATGQSSTQLYLIQADGSGTRPVALHTTYSTFAAAQWSPDGQHIALIGLTGQAMPQGGRNLGEGARDLLVLRLGDSTPLRVTPPSAFQVGPYAWSPDGKRLAYLATSYGPRGQARGQVGVVDADGANRVQLLDLGVLGQDYEVHLASLAWSPDGEHVAFSLKVRRNTYCSTLHLMQVDGTGLVRLDRLCFAMGTTAPSWSADSQWLALSTWQQPGGDSAIAVVNVAEALRDPSGDTAVVLTRGNIPDQNPQWQPIVTRKP